MIRHAAALSVLPLTIAVVEPPFDAGLMPPVCFTVLKAVCLRTTRFATVALSAITRAADEKQSPAIRGLTNESNENDFRGIRHPSPQARLDNGRKSWQAQAVRVALVCQSPAPVVDGDRGHLAPSFLP